MVVAAVRDHGRVMGAVLLLARSELRRRWQGLAVLTLLVGFAGGVTFSAVAGARRTSSSFDRFIESTRNQDVLVFADDVRPADVARLRSLPGVDAIGYARQLAVLRPDGEFLAVGGPLDEALFRDVYRLRIVDGRTPAPGAADQVVIGEPLARANGIGVGEVLRVQSYTQEQIELILGGTEVDPAGPEVRLHVVGISRTPSDLSLQGTNGGILLVPRAFVEKYGSTIGNYGGEDGAVLLVRLADGNDGVPRFLDQVRQVLGDRPFDVDPAALSVGGVQESIDLLAIALLAFGAVAGAAGLMALGLTTSRQVSLIGAGQAAVRDLGLSRPLRAVAIAAPVLLAVGAGVVVATLLAWAASPLLPFGVAGDAEPEPGLHFDALVLGVGAIATLVLLGAVVAIAAWRAALAPEASRFPRRPSVIARALESIGLAPPATVGVRMALEPGRGRTAVPVRSSLVGAGVAVLGVTAVAVFGASLDGLLDTPSAFGRPWDVVVIDARAQLDREGSVCAGAQTRLLNDPDIDAIASACTMNIAVDGRAIGAFGITPLRGAVEPTVLEGQSPRGPNDIALGTQTLDALGLELGDRVTGRTQAGSAEYRIVGRVVVPSLADPQAIADGAVFTGAGLDRLDTPNDNLGSFDFVVRFRQGVDEARAAARIRKLPGIGAHGQPGVVVPTVPLEVDRLQQIDRIPIVLATFLAAVGALAVGHLLVTSVRRRRRDFAVLKSMGFTRRQVLATVTWQATTVAGFGLLVGLILGVIAGGALWRAAAGRVGVVPAVDLPIAVLAAVALAAVAITNLVAAFPARTAARTHPAVTLRSE